MEEEREKAPEEALLEFNAQISKAWREEDLRWRAEDRQWRADDVRFREEERKWFQQEQLLRESEKLWRVEDIEQRHVENARYLWARFAEKNRRDVEEKSEQLKAISNLSALFAGFAVVTLTQFQFDFKDSSIVLIAIYGVLTAFTVCLMTIAMVLCTLILGSILKNGKEYVNEDAEEHFMMLCRDFVRAFHLGDRPPAPRRTFEKFWENRCERDWRLAFALFTWGIFAFLVSLVPIGFIKFDKSKVTVYCFMGVIIVSIIVWGYKQMSWGSYLTDSNEKLLDGESFRTVPVGFPWDWHIMPQEAALGGAGPSVAPPVTPSRTTSAASLAAAAVASNGPATPRSQRSQPSSQR